MSSEDLDEMLNSPNKGVDKATGVLARLFRQILIDANISTMAWATLMERYLEDPRNRVPKNGKDRSSARGNLNKELRRPTMTWKVFRKGIQFLNIVHVRFEVHATWANRKKTVTGINIPIAHTSATVGQQLSHHSEEDEPEMLQRELFKNEGVGENIRRQPTSF